MNTKNHREYSETFKLQVLQDYYSSGQSKRSIERKWQIPSGRIYFWEKAFPIDNFPLPLPSESFERYMMEHEKKDPSTEEMLLKRIDDLQRSLEYEKMRSRAFERMIEIAEQEEGISILKKGGVKQ
ncbi:MAG: hypothetical protein Q4E63_01160 [Prevotellaceae bacterium]|nr:hypothetical protein [Prevotellaceae bacterium]MDO4931251.1 hypothetical protein [Prevotellaceae bacterium]